MYSGILEEIRQRGEDMLGAAVNGIAILVGSLVGLLLSRGIKENTKETIMQGGMSLAVIAIGITGSLESENLLVVIGSVAIGAWLGEIIDIHGWLEGLGHKLESRFSKNGTGISKGFVTGTVIYCSGAMAIVGAMESGLTGNHQTLFTKSIIDGITSVLFTSTFGIGVAFSAVPVFLYEGAISLASSVVSDLLTDAMIADMSAVGGLLILAIGLNVLGVVKIRVANMLPAVFTPIAIYAVLGLFV